MKTLYRLQMETKDTGKHLFVAFCGSQGEAVDALLDSRSDRVGKDESMTLKIECLSPSVVLDIVLVSGERSIRMSVREWLTVLCCITDKALVFRVDQEDVLRPDAVLACL